MKTITTATEKRIAEMVKTNSEHGRELNYWLNEMKGSISYYGATIKEIKAAGLELKNATQMKAIIGNLARGMGVEFEKYMTVCDCLDLQYINIDDFNGLVKECHRKYA